MKTQSAKAKGRRLQQWFRDLLIEELKSDNYTILHPDNTVICKVRTSRAAIEVEEVAEETTEDSEEGQEEETKSGTTVE